MQSPSSGSLLNKGSKFLRKPFKAKINSLRYHAGRLRDKLLKKTPPLQGNCTESSSENSYSRSDPYFIFNLGENDDSNPFDAPKSIVFNIAKLKHLESLQLPLEGKTVLDVGCGPGHLANFFVKKGCDVMSIDGRKENIDRLKHLYPSLNAMVVDVEKDPIEKLGKFQIVFCYGLLYHLENPYNAVQKLAHVCDELLLLETCVCDYDQPLLLMKSEPLAVDQAKSGIGCRPSPSYVTLILTRAGFPYVYSPVHNPAYPDFQFEWKNNLESERDNNNLRCIFVASRTELKNKNLVKCSVI